MNLSYYQNLYDSSILKKTLAKNEYLKILSDSNIELLPLLWAAYGVRKHFYSNKVKIHILNNVQNGHCQEDCSYCAQSKESNAKIDSYPMKTEEEIINGANQAYQAGSSRYCMVFSGKSPSLERTKKIAAIVQKIKKSYKIQTCVSAGILTTEHAKILKDAGCDRINHNLNTTEKNYPKICTTHSYQDRLNTIFAANEVGLEICSGLIVGMGEDPSDLVNLALTLKKINIRSVPINFLIPIEGTKIEISQKLDPDYCLKVLCLFRFLLPDIEIRAAAGREFHLRSMEVMCLYPANSIFLEGYLNTPGRNSEQVLQMIKDAGFDLD